MGLRSQVTGTLANLRVTATTVTLGDLLPPSIVSTLVWARDTIPRGLGFAPRTGHLTGVIALTAVMIIASATLLTAVALAFFAIAFPIALLRFIPAVNRRWPLETGNWPLWDVRSEGFGA